MKFDTKFFLKLSLLIVAGVCLVFCIHFNHSNQSTDSSKKDTAQYVDKLYKEINWSTQANDALAQLNDITGTGYQTIDEMKQDILQFNYASQVVSHLQDNLPDSTKKELRKLKSALIAKQVKTFPMLRQALVEFYKKAFWQADVDVEGSGSTLYFTAGDFAAHRNIAKAESDMDDQFRLFRFKQINYRWYKNQSDYTFYKLDTKKDSDIEPTY